MPGYPVPAGIDPEELEYELEREEARDRARNGLLNFTLFTKPDYSVQWYHKVLAKKLNDFAEGKIKRLMVFMPPRHGKSELVSRRLPAYILGRNPDANVIAATHTADLAGKMNRDVQRIIDSSEYRELFPDTKLVPFSDRKSDDRMYIRNSSEFEIVGFEGSYKSVGVTGPLAGRGADFLLLDDPVKDQKEVDSEVQRNALWDWYVNVFSTRASPTAGILITLTRWHELDVAGMLLKAAKEDPEADQWEIVSFPAIKEANEVPHDTREEGEALWPERYPIARLKAQRATGGTRKFNSIYQQRPSAEEGEILKRAWMQKRYTRLPDLGEKNRWNQLLVSGDLRFKDDKNSGDYVVYEAWARLGSQFYFLGEARDRWGFIDSVAEFQKIIAKTPIGGFRLGAHNEKLIENKANGPALENVLKKKVPGIILVEPDGGKTARVNAVTPLWEAGNVWLPDPSIYPPINAIVEEWVSFGPGCAFDDRTDAMSQALLRLSEGAGNYLEDLTRM